MQLRDAGRLALDDPLERAPARHRRRRASPCASCSATPAACNANPTATGGSAPRAPTWTTLLAGLTADKIAYPPHRGVPLLQPGVRAARRGAGRLTGTRLGATCSTERILDAAGHAPHHLPGHRAVRPRLRRAPLARHAARGAAHRHRRDGPGRAALVDDRGPGPLGRVPGRPRPGGARPRRPLTEMCAPVVISDLDSWTRRARPRPRAVPRSASGCTSGTAARCPATSPRWPCTGPPAPPWSASPTRTACGPASSASSAGNLLTTVLDARAGARPAPWRPGRPRPPAGRSAELTGRWWWMGEEYEFALATAHRGDLVRTRLRRRAGRSASRPGGRTAGGAAAGARGRRDR